MATPDVTAGTIMDTVAGLLNDTAKSMYTYVKQLPYLKVALKDLRELFELNNIPVTDTISSILIVPKNTTTISFVSNPALPSNLISIEQLWESPSGSNTFVPITKKGFIPHYYDNITVSAFGVWTWIGNTIKLPSANQIIDLKLDYIAELFSSVVDQNSVIGVINGESFLHYRTAALCAEFIMENPTRAASLNSQASMALDRVTGIENKGKQVIVTRHRPFRASYKRGGHPF